MPDLNEQTGIDRGDAQDSSQLRVNASEVGAPRYFQHLSDQVWAVQSPQVLRELSAIVQRQGSVEAVERWRSQRAEDARTARVRDGVAVVSLMGPILPRATLFSMISGATSIDVLARDLQQMADRSDIRAILLEIDSPGGAVTDVDQMAQVIADIGRQKPITAYVGGTAASAAYWLATAAREIVVARTGQVGGIGVVATIPKQQEPDEMGVMDFEVVSANADQKRPDPETNAGQEAVLERINPIEQTFIETVASNRGVGPDTVRQEFGRGNVVVGSAAVRRNMADRIGTFEGVLAELQQVPYPQSTSAAAAAAQSNPQTQEEDTMSEGTEQQAAETQQSAAQAEQTQQQGQPAGQESQNEAANPADIISLCNASGTPELAESLVRQGATMEQARARVNAVGTMRERCEAAVSASMVSQDKADELRQAAVKAGKTPEQLSDDLFMAAVQHQSPDQAVQSRIAPDARASDATQGWDHAAQKVAAQTGAANG